MDNCVRMNSPEIPNEQPNAKMIAFALSLAVLWGGNSVSIKIALQGVPPLALAGFRFLLALIAVTAWSISQRVTIRLNRGELVPLLLLGIAFVLQIITLNVGTRFTSAARSTIMINFFPVLYGAFRALLGAGRPTVVYESHGDWAGILRRFHHVCPISSTWL